MNRKTLLMIVCFTMTNITIIYSQDWTIGGNPNADVPAAGGRLGTNGDRALIFETNNTERGRLVNITGFWGFGTASPNAKVHVNGTGTDNPFRVQVNGASKLYVDNGGGVSVGSSSIPPANGLFVSGNTTIGTSVPAANFRTTINETANAALILGTLNGVGSYLTVNKPSTSSSTEVVRIRDNGSTFATFNSIAATFQLTVTGDALASGGTWQNSDKRIKRDIKPITSAMDNLMKLKPSVYYFDRDQEKYKYLNLPKDLQFGLIAQEVKEVFPNIVREYNTYDEEGKARAETMHSINYTELIPVLIKGMQEQQKMIVALQERIAQFEGAAISEGGSNNAKAGNALVSGAVLEQNQPNPFNQNTIIRYQLPQNAAGQINIFDNYGKLLKSIKVTESGQTTINAGDLKSGTYTYTLSVNGKLASSKKLVIAK